MNPEKITKMDEEVKKWSRKDPMAIKKAMVYPHTLEALERGAMVKDYNANSTNLDSEDEEDPRTPASVSSQVSFKAMHFRGHSGSHGIHRFPKRDPPSSRQKYDTWTDSVIPPSRAARVTDRQRVISSTLRVSPPRCLIHPCQSSTYR